MANRSKVYPVPELVLDDHIRIEGVSTGGSMDNSARLMRVPLLDTPACRHVRAHEMAHAKYSPDKPICPYGVNPMTIQRVEDMRMNMLCRGQELHEAMDAPIVEPNMWARLLTGKRENLTAGISTFDTGDWPEFIRHAHPSDDDVALIERVAESLKSDPTWRNTQRQASAVEAYLRGEEKSEPEPDPSDDENSSDGEQDGEDQPSDASGDPGESDSGESEPSDDDSDDDSDMDSEPGDPGDSDSDSDGDSDSSGEGSPGEDDGEPDGSPMELHGDILDTMVDRKLDDAAKAESMTPFERGIEILENCRKHYARGEATVTGIRITTKPMPVRLPPNKFKSRAKVPADRGMVPKHMNRYCTDKAIFAGRGRKRSQGGTILIDASASMSLSSEQVDELMTLAPLGTIATYSGDFGGDSGDLWIIAKDGKRATGTLTPPGPLNKVDVPALEWMSKQAPPYYWVCDGGVSGGNRGTGGEKFGENIFEKCIEIVERHEIIMVPNIENLPDTMKATL